MRVKIILVINITALVILVIAVGAGLRFAEAQMTETIEMILLSVADTADRLISSEMNLLKSNVQTAAWHVRVATYSGTIHETLEQQVMVYPGFLALTIIKVPNENEGEDWATGAYISDSAGSPPVPAELVTSEYVRWAAAGASVISTTRHDPESGTLVIHVCVPLAGNRVLIATIDGFYFCNVLANLSVWGSGHIFIVDQSGTMISNPRREWVQSRFNIFEQAGVDPQFDRAARVMAKIVQGEVGIGRYPIDGEERICVYRPISGSTAGWSLGVVAPAEEGPITNIRYGFIMVGVLSVLLSVVVAFLASGILEKPYTTLSGVLSAMKYQEELLHTTNQVADKMLRSHSSCFRPDLHECMGLMAQSINVDRMRIFANVSGENGEVRAVLRHEWLREAPYAPLGTIQFSYHQRVRRWYSMLSQGQIINSLVRDLPEDEQKILKPHQVVSILVFPLFIHNEFWGFASFDDCHKERIFTTDELGLMSAGTSFATNARERNDMEADLIRAQEEAVASTEAKSRFLANMSHEMRTPLNAVIGLTELTLDAGRLHEEDEENIVKIYNSGVILLGLINDILDLSKIESGKFEIIPVIYNMPSLINDTITLNSVRIGSKPITFQIHIDGSLPNTLKGDDLRIKQIFNNLLSNAFKYTREGRVDWTISCRRDGDSLWLNSTIKDTGIGIRPDDLKKLFSDYNQVDTRSNRKIEGTGLGLSITKRMAEMMDGGISVESEYGVGSTFTLNLRQGFVNDVPIGDEVAERLMSFHYSERKRDRSAKLLRVPVPYAKVLVVDDVTINLDVARGLLKPYQMQVDCVTSGPDAIGLIREEKVRYNAVFMDHMMPEMDGIEAVRIIRKEIGTEYAKTVPIIALTANAIVGNEEMFLSKGFQAFLSKPIDIRALDSAINRWVRNKALERELAAQGGGNAAAGGAVESAKAAEPDIHQAVIGQLRLEGIDTAAGLRNFGGDAESYRSVLGSYVTNTPPLLDKIRRGAADDIATYRVIVHGIKSASRSIGAAALGTTAESLEFAARDNNAAFIGETNDAFVAAVERLITELAAFLREHDEPQQRPLKPEPDHALLAALREACASFDADQVDQAMEQLESSRYESGGDLVSWLRERVDAADYDQIAERLAGESGGSTG
jgi:signal transduction histidine kinase/CheY-like chemotaxis protein